MGVLLLLLLLLLCSKLTKQSKQNKAKLTFSNRFAIMSARSVLYYLKKTIFSLLVLSNLVGCIGFALLASYINNNFSAVYYAGKTKPIDVS